MRDGDIPSLSSGYHLDLISDPDTIDSERYCCSYSPKCLEVRCSRNSLQCKVEKKDATRQMTNGQVDSPRSPLKEAPRGPIL